MATPTHERTPKETRTGNLPAISPPIFGDSAKSAVWNPDADFRQVGTQKLRLGGAKVFTVVPNTKAITAHTSRSPWLLFVVFVVLPLFLLLAIASEVPRAGGRSRNRFNNVKTSAQQDQTMRSKEERRTLFSRNTIMTSRRRSRSEEEGGRQECSFFSSWLVV